MAVRLKRSAVGAANQRHFHHPWPAGERKRHYNTLKDHLDSVFSLAVAARKGKFDFYGDVGYMKFSLIAFGPGAANAWSGLKFLVADAGVGYLLVKTDSEHPFLLEGTAGVRYWYASDRLTVTGPLGDVRLRAARLGMWWIRCSAFAAANTSPGNFTWTSQATAAGSTSHTTPIGPGRQRGS